MIDDFGKSMIFLIQRKNLKLKNAAKQRRMAARKHSMSRANAISSEFLRRLLL